MTRFEPSKDVLSGKTADVYFARSIEVLKKERVNPVATMEIFASRAGVLCGIEESKVLLSEVLPPDKSEAWALEEGQSIEKKEVVLRITAPYLSYGLYETALCGIMAQASGWASAAAECVAAAGETPVVSFGVRHVHPNVAGILDYAAIIGGCLGCSSTVGAELAGVNPSGTMPHAFIIVLGDTVQAAIAFNEHMPPEIPRIVLVDTFKDEAEESLRVAASLVGKLASVRLDTPFERGGVSPDLVKEVRARLDRASFDKVGIFVSGGLTPERIKHFSEAGAPIVGFGIGSYISSAAPLDFTADLHEINGRAVAKRGRIPGITKNPRLKKII